MKGNLLNYLFASRIALWGVKLVLISFILPNSGFAPLLGRLVTTLKYYLMAQTQKALLWSVVDLIFKEDNLLREIAPMNNTSSANVSIDVKPGLSLSALSRPEGIAWCTVFSLFSLFITVGNLLTIVLFAANKRVRKKSLYLVINMALADLLLGAFALPLYIYVSISNEDCEFDFGSCLWALIRNFTLGFIDICSFHIMWEVLRRILAIQTQNTNRANIPRCLVCFMDTLSSESHCPIYLRSYNYFISHARSSYGVTARSIICGSNIAIWRKFRHGNVTSQQKKRDEKTFVWRRL